MLVQNDNRTRPARIHRRLHILERACGSANICPPPYVEKTNRHFAVEQIVFDDGGVGNIFGNGAVYLSRLVWIYRIDIDVAHQRGVNRTSGFSIESAGSELPGGISQPHKRNRITDKQITAIRFIRFSFHRRQSSQRVAFFALL